MNTHVSKNDSTLSHHKSIRPISSRCFLAIDFRLPSVWARGSGQIQVPAEFLRPITYVQPHLFKIERGKIREIEGLSWPVPFGMKSGWDQ